MRLISCPPLKAVNPVSRPPLKAVNPVSCGSRHITGSRQLGELVHLRNQLQSHLQQWQEQLEHCYNCYSCLTFYNPNQIFQLQHIVESLEAGIGGSAACRQVQLPHKQLSLLHFACPSLATSEQCSTLLQRVRQQARKNGSPERKKMRKNTGIFGLLSQIIFGDSTAASDMSDEVADTAVQQLRHICATLQELLEAQQRAEAGAAQPWEAPGAPAPASVLDPGSVVTVLPTDSVHSPLQLLLNAHAALRQTPEANRVLLCTARTSWIEVELLLRRLTNKQCEEGTVLGSSSSSSSGSSSSSSNSSRAPSDQPMDGSWGPQLFCLVDVHRLQDSVQMKLIARVRQLSCSEQPQQQPPRCHLLVTWAASEPCHVKGNALASGHRHPRYNNNHCS